jgi:hypothetical protein
MVYLLLQLLTHDMQLVQRHPGLVSEDQEIPAASARPSSRASSTWGTSPNRFHMHLVQTALRAEGRAAAERKVSWIRWQKRWLRSQATNEHGEAVKQHASRVNRH